MYKKHFDHFSYWYVKKKYDVVSEAPCPTQTVTSHAFLSVFFEC